MKMAYSQRINLLNVEKFIQKKARESGINISFELIKFNYSLSLFYTKSPLLKTQ